MSSTTGLKLPDLIRIGRHNWEVDIVAIPGGFRGLCHFDDKVIELDKRLGPQKMLETLSHEYLHACLAKVSHQTIYKLERPMAEFAKIMIAAQF